MKLLEYVHFGFVLSVIILLDALLWNLVNISVMPLLALFLG